MSGCRICSRNTRMRLVPRWKLVPMIRLCSNTQAGPQASRKARSLRIAMWSRTPCRSNHGWSNLGRRQGSCADGIPLFHVYGMVAGMNFAMATGSSMVMVPNARDLKDVLDNISKYQCTIFPGVPALYNGINNHPDVKAEKYDLSSIKACISGSAPLMRETKEQFEKLTGGKVFEGYGLSEAPTATHCNPLLGDKQDRLHRHATAQCGSADHQP